jgi:hypothetical protein
LEVRNLERRSFSAASGAAAALNILMLPRAFMLKATGALEDADDDIQAA